MRTLQTWGGRGRGDEALDERGRARRQKEHGAPTVRSNADQASLTKQMMIEAFGMAESAVHCGGKVQNR